MERRQFLWAGASVLAVPTVTAGTEGSVQTERLEVDDYRIGGGDPEAESITLRNVSGERLELSNWTVEDDGVVPAETVSPFVFPSGVVLAPNATVTIVTGDGRDTDETVHWGLGRQVWSEEGDVVYVRDAAGELVLEAPIAGEEL